MVALLERSNGCLVGEDQRLPRWSGPMVALLRTNGCLVGEEDLIFDDLVSLLAVRL